MDDGAYVLPSHGTLSRPFPKYGFTIYDKDGGLAI